MPTLFRNCFVIQLIPVLEELEVPYTTINEFDMRGKVRDRATAAKDEPLSVHGNPNCDEYSRYLVVR